MTPPLYPVDLRLHSQKQERLHPRLVAVEVAIASR